MSIFISQFAVELLLPFGEAPPPPPVTPEARTMRFDAGLGSEWWLVPQITDSNDNLRDKCPKSFIVTGKLSNPLYSFYIYGPHRDVNVEQIERGTDSFGGKKRLPSTTQVQRSARQQVNYPNAMLWTFRLEGICDIGDGSMLDRVDEVVVEVAAQGIRR